MTSSEATADDRERESKKQPKLVKLLRFHLLFPDNDMGKMPFCPLRLSPHNGPVGSFLLHIRILYAMEILFACLKCKIGLSVVVLSVLVISVLTEICLLSLSEGQD